MDCSTLLHDAPRRDSYDAERRTTKGQSHTRIEASLANKRIHRPRAAY